MNKEISLEEIKKQQEQVLVRACAIASYLDVRIEEDVEDNSFFLTKKGDRILNLTIKSPLAIYWYLRGVGDTTDRNLNWESKVHQHHMKTDEWYKSKFKKGYA